MFYRVPFCPCLPTTSAHRGHAGPATKRDSGKRTGRGGAGGVAHRTSTPRHPRRQRIGTARRRSCRHPPRRSCSPRRLVQRSDRRIGESWQGKSCGTGVRRGRGRPVGEVGSGNRQIKSGSGRSLVGAGCSGDRPAAPQTGADLTFRRCQPHGARGEMSGTQSRVPQNLTNICIWVNVSATPSALFGDSEGGQGSETHPATAAASAACT